MGCKTPAKLIVGIGACVGSISFGDSAVANKRQYISQQSFAILGLCMRSDLVA